MFRLRLCQLARVTHLISISWSGATTVSLLMAFSDRFLHLSPRRPKDKPVTAGTFFFSISVARVSGLLSTRRAEQGTDIHERRRPGIEGVPQMSCKQRSKCRISFKTAGATPALLLKMTR